MEKTDWAQWHEGYDSDEAPLARRLLVVQRFIRDFLDSRTDGRLRAVSMCAGEGRDLLGVLEGHPAAPRVSARLVELDARNAAAARERAARAGLVGVEVVVGDASTTRAYAGATPADLVLACGIFGNIPDADIRRTIEALPQLCRRGALVLWTRHRRDPDLTPTIRGWFRETGFDELGFEPLEPPRGRHPPQSVGAHVWPHDPLPLEPDLRLFSFFR